MIDRGDGGDRRRYAHFDCRGADAPTATAGCDLSVGGRRLMEVMEVTVEGIELETLRLQLLLLSAPDVMELATQGARVVVAR